MPDRDFYRRTPSYAWRGACRMVAANASPAELAGPVRGALVRTLRYGSGIPGFSAIAEVLELTAKKEITVPHARNRLDNIEGSLPPSTNSLLGVNAARSLLAELAFGASLPADPRTAIAERTCLGLLAHNFLHLAQINELGQRFSNISAAHQWESDCRTEFQPDLQKIAAAIVADPSARLLRAPSRRRPRQGTAALLHQPLTVEAGL